jgi:hypothetical protein
LIRSFFRTKVPAFRRVLLVESGSRDLLEGLIPGIYKSHKNVQVDLVTCYAGQPVALHEGARVYRVTDYGGAAGRERLLADVKAAGYDVLGLICSAEPIMTKWKWWLAWKLPQAKAFALNENGDYFWIDRAHSDILLHFVLFRIGMTGAGAPAAIARLLFLPVSATGLVLFACMAHARRALRPKSSLPSR